MSLMLMITMVKNLLTMSEGFGWQRYKKYLYQPPSYREIAFWNGKHVLQMVTRQRPPYKGLQVRLAGGGRARLKRIKKDSLHITAGGVSLFH